MVVEAQGYCILPETDISHLPLQGEPQEERFRLPSINFLGAKTVVF